MKTRLIALAVTATLLGGCAASPFRAEHPAPAAAAAAKPAVAPAEKPAPAAPVVTAESRLAAGIQAYENGDYALSQQELQAALDQDMADVGDRVTANKLLAFIACATRQFDSCKGRFRRVLALNPKFTLSAAEAGHPTWGPVFKEVKGEGGGKAAATPAKTGKAKPKAK